jgi:hypothetical protein
MLPEAAIVGAHNKNESVSAIGPRSMPAQGGTT